MADGQYEDPIVKEREVRLDEDDEDKGIPDYDDDDPNLVQIFVKSEAGKRALEKLASRVIKDFDEDFESCKDFREKVAKNWKLYSGDIPPKTGPFKDSANPHVPILFENLSRQSQRIMGEVFGDYTNFCGWMPTGPDDEEEAQILTLHNNWQMREQIKDFGRQMERGLTSFMLWGDSVCQSYYDEERQTNRHEVLTPDDFVMPYVHVTVQPDLSDCPHYTRILHMYDYSLKRMRKVWYGVDEVLERGSPSWNDEPEQKLRESIADAAGAEIPEDDKETAPYQILWYEGWYRLPKQDAHRWIKAIVDKKTRLVLQLQIHEEEDWHDTVRFETQSAEFDAFQEAMAAYQAQIQQYDAQVQLGTEQGVPPEAMLQIPEPQRPPAPAWAETLEDGVTALPPVPPKRVPIRLFTHAVCMENMLGARGLSVGSILADFNRAANVAMSQFTDAATLGNCSTFIVPKTMQFDGEFEFGPGRVNRVLNYQGDDIRRQVMELRPDTANAQLFQVTQAMYQWGQSAAQSPGVLSGEEGKSGETYRGISARLEQATKQLGFIARKFADNFVKPILINNAKLNAKFLPDFEIIQVVDWKLPFLTRKIQISRSMYSPNYKVELRADLKFMSDSQRVQEAMEMLQLPMAVPPLQGNIAFLHAAARKYLEAKQAHDLIRYLGPAPPAPNTPFGLMPPAPVLPPGDPGEPPPEDVPTGGPTPEPGSAPEPAPAGGTP